MKTDIIGGGAAGFFLAINLKEMVPEMEVCILERSNRVLRKVELSGGGRCNLTNTFEDVDDLSTVYPRGHRLLKRLFKGFDHQDTCDWFERHGVPLMTQPDHRVFPASQDSHTIIDCLQREARRLGVKIMKAPNPTFPVGMEYIDSPADNTNHSLPSGRDGEGATFSGRDGEGASFLAICTGGSPKREGLRWLEEMGHEIADPVPSLFTFNIKDKALNDLSGTTIDNVTAFITGSKYRSTGSMLITHWGLSGPAILKLSSHEARTLADNNYRMPLSINWTNCKEAEVREHLQSIISHNGNRLIANYRPFGLPQRLWDYLAGKIYSESRQRTWASLNRKELNKIVNSLCNDEYTIEGRGAYKEEFVTCGGVALASVNPSTMESRCVPNMFFAGEVLDIDGITGGFNFQAAWTTAYTAARAISEKTTALKR